MRSVVACLRPDRPAACPFAADSNEPDRPQAVKIGAVAPPLRGFGLDGLTPPRFGLSKQTKADRGRTALPTQTKRSQRGFIVVHWIIFLPVQKALQFVSRAATH